MIDSASIIFIDMGRRTGWAKFDPASGLYSSGSFDLGEKNDIGERIHRFGTWLKLEIRSLSVRPIVIGYEQPAMFGGAKWHLGAYQGEIWRVAYLEGVGDTIPVAISTLKKAATGNGRAGKLMMIEAAQKRMSSHGWGSNAIDLDDNEADAVNGLFYVKETATIASAT